MRAASEEGLSVEQEVRGGLLQEQAGLSKILGAPEAALSSSGTDPLGRDRAESGDTQENLLRGRHDLHGKRLGVLLRPALLRVHREAQVAGSLEDELVQGKAVLPQQKV